VAASYDGTFGQNAVGRLFRFRLAERVMSGIAPGSRVLDIGCGTGEDAWWLAGQGYAVLGIDESPRMIEAARAKSSRPGLEIEFQCLSVEAFAAQGRKFDAVISNFGALNCVPLAQWTEIVPRLLNSGGRGFAVLMGDRPLPERLRIGSGGRSSRKRQTEVAVGSSPVTVHYESASTIRAALERTARVDHVETMGCLVPGPAFADFPRRHPLITGVLAMGESVVRTAPWFRDVGDHTLFEFTAR
jgi:SAM-dependent methyltransferase